MTEAMPHRVWNLAAARRSHGDLIDRLAPWFFRADPLADAATAVLAPLPDSGRALLDAAIGQGSLTGAPAELRALFDALDHVPVWVDREQVARAGKILFRAGAIGPIVLAARSLAAGYCSPAGNKPLVLTGRLGGPAQGQRLAETGRFIAAVCEPEGLERGGAGFALCVRVRMMHARVRWLIRRTNQWRPAEWGEPINQHDMMATSLLFSQVFIDGLRQFGLVVSPQDGVDWLHLWRWASFLLGTDDALLPTTESAAVRLLDIIKTTQQPPDDDSRRLVRGILDLGAKGWPGGVAVAEGFCRSLLGDELADGLELPKTPYRHAVAAARLVVGPVDRLRSVSRHLDAWFIAFGRRYWDDAIARSAAGAPLTFAPPLALHGVRKGAEPRTHLQAGE